MKKQLKSFIAVVLAALLPTLIPCAMYGDSFEGLGGQVYGYWNQITNESALPYNNSYVTDLSALKVARVSAEVTAATATIAALNFNDGTASTASVTVISTTTISSAAATITLTVNSTQTNAGSWFSINGSYIVQGYQWTNMSVASNTAINISTVINAGNYGVTASTVGISSITLTAIQWGTIGNSYFIGTSTPAALTVNLNTVATSSPMTGGLDAPFIKFIRDDGRAWTLTQGIDWSVGTTSSATAKNISNALMAISSVSAVITSTWTPGGIVTATSTAINKNTYQFFTSTQTKLQLGTTTAVYSNGSAIGSFTGGTAGNIDTVNNLVTGVSNLFTTGLPVLYTKTAGTSPGLLTVGTTYFVTSPTKISFALALTSTGAVAAVATTISTQTAAGGGSFTLTPSVFTGTAGYIFEVSNDSSSWNQIGSSFTLTSVSASSTTWQDFGNVNWRYFRERFVAPTFGGVNLKTWITGKN